MNDEPKSTYSPMRVAVQGGTKAATKYLRNAVAESGALAGGFAPSPANDLVFRGGKTLRELRYINFFVAGETGWSVSDMDNIDRALAAAMGDRNLNHVVMQYFGNQPVLSQFLGSRRLPGAPPLVFSRGDTELFVRRLHQGGALAGMDLSKTVVNLFLPPGAILTTDAALANVVVAAALDPGIPLEDEASSASGLGGYHGSVVDAVAGVSATVYYAVGAYSERRPGGFQNGIVVFDEPWKNVVATFYHELQEARTDPDVEDAIRTGNLGFAGWTSARGEEIGDAPIRMAGSLPLVFREVPLAGGGNVVPIQLLYSNAVHGPEGPIDQPHN
jgi:hypothetical protein